MDAMTSLKYKTCKLFFTGMGTESELSTFYNVKVIMGGELIS